VQISFPQLMSSLMLRVAFRKLPGRPVDTPLLLITPPPCLTIQVLHIRKPSARHEMLLNEMDRPFRLALQKDKSPSGIGVVPRPKAKFQFIPQAVVPPSVRGYNEERI